MFPKRYYKLVFLFLTPGLVLYLIFVVYPTINAFIISFFNWRGVSRQMTFAGLGNYRELFQDPVLWKALEHNAFFALVFPIAILVPAFIFALAFQSKVLGANLYRIVFLFPNLMSVTVVAILWSFLYEPTMGPINSGLRLIGLDSLARPWLGDPKVALPALVMPIAWINIGFYVLIIHAGLINIPQDLYDAAAMDGAYGWKRFWYITIPLLWEVITIVTIYVVAGALNEFSIVLIMTNGGPSRATELLTTYMYKMFLSSEYGYGTAIGVLQFVLCVFVLVFARRLMNREAIEF
ncbi:MAG: sugar ABC transporter permease [Anaerolineales bacterium]|jgi:N-acetylglucosamine transport system permease protein